MLWVVLFVPVSCAALSGLAPWRRVTGWAGAASALSVLVVGVTLAVRVVHGRPETGYGGVLRADALSAFMVIVIGVIAVLATLQGVRYLEAEIAAGRCTPRHASLYAVLIQGFLATMLLAVLAANLGVMWVAVEATTIVTTFLVGHRNTRGSLEASWKYIVICSVGIALAFLGTVLVYLAALHVTGHGTRRPGLDVAGRPLGPPQPRGHATRLRPRSCWDSARRSVSRRCTAGCPTPTARPPRRCRR